ncbi:MAG: endonuclease NucS domain-containing protein [Parasphingopyxis sp.]|uniref:endonuclease NucS domain-containing protein n=1 Tax=Parasphingopyxis sp. TaxID=1920299 RepID=UPI003F9ECF3C
MDPRYSDWLRRAVPSESTWQTKLSELRRVEREYGDVDEHFDEDELQSVLESLVYSAEDERLGADNPSKIVIEGNLRNGLSGYKSAVQKYVRFRQDVESEAARPAIAALRVDDLSEEDNEQTFSLERDLQSALRSSIEQLETGLEIIDGGVERSVPSGRIDILAKDGEAKPVVIELKAVKAGRDAVAQVLAYMGDVSMDSDAPVRGFLVAPEFDARAISAARMVPTLELIEYGFSFSFRPRS